MEFWRVLAKLFVDTEILYKKIMRIQKKERGWCVLAEGLMLLQ